MLPNVIGTANLLERARSCGASSFLFFRSGEVYGALEAAAMPVPEDAYGKVDPTALRSCYAESKRMGEAMCAAWAGQHAVPARIVRPFHTYGPGMQLDDGRVCADFIADILAGRDISMKSDGSASRAFCYLADAVLGFFTVMLKGESGQAYNIGNEGAELSILELAERLLKAFSGQGTQANPAGAPGRPRLFAKSHRPQLPGALPKRGPWAGSPSTGLMKAF